MIRQDRSSESATLGPDVDQARALVAAATTRGPRDRAVLLVLLSTGMRVSELTGLRTEDMGHHDARRYLTVVRKGGKRQRLVLVPDAAAAVDAMLEHRAATDVGTAVAVPPCSTTSPTTPTTSTPASRPCSTTTAHLGAESCRRGSGTGYRGAGV